MRSQSLPCDERLLLGHTIHPLGHLQRRGDIPRPRSVIDLLAGLVGSRLVTLLMFSRSNLSYFFFGTAYRFLVLSAGTITSFEFFIFWMSLSRWRGRSLLALRKSMFSIIFKRSSSKASSSLTRCGHFLVLNPNVSLDSESSESRSSFLRKKKAFQRIRLITSFSINFFYGHA